MPVTLPLEVYEVFEKGLGKEDARKLVKSFEAAISDITEYKWKTTKDELLDSIRKEFVTRELFEEKLNTLKVDLEGKMDTLKVDLVGKMDTLKVDIDGKMGTLKVDIDGRFERLNQKFNFMIVLIIIALTLMNPVAAEIIKNILKL